MSAIDDYHGNDDFERNEEELDLLSLYSKGILALAAGIGHIERLDAPDATVTRRSPLCGSTVTVDVVLKENRLAALGMEVRACVLGQASAAILARNAKGCSTEEIIDLRDTLNSMLKHKGKPPSGAFAELKALTPARLYKYRHASILLAYEALAEAMQEAQ